jgi:hypothetical protein
MKRVFGQTERKISDLCAVCGQDLRSRMPMWEWRRKSGIG